MTALSALRAGSIPKLVGLADCCWWNSWLVGMVAASGFNDRGLINYVSTLELECLSREWSNFVMFHTTDPTLSLSPLEMLRRCIVDHHTLPVVHSLCLSGQFLYLRHPTICENTLTLSSAFHLSMDSTQHMYTYPASRITVTHRADTICSVSLATCLFYYSTCYFSSFHMLFLNLPHACCPLLPIMFHPFSI